MTSKPQRPHSDRKAPAVLTFATTAYRADLANRPHPFGEHDSEWLAIANLLEQAAQRSARQSATLLRHAGAIAVSVIALAALDELVQREYRNGKVRPTDAIVAVAGQLHHRGAFRLAGHILDSLLAAHRSLSDLQRGRIVAERARIAHKLGNLDGAADRYALVLRLGRTLRSPELQARAWVGHAAIAQFHGNYPEVWRCAMRAARIADAHDFRALSRYAHNSLMVAGGVSGRIDDTLAHGWLAYQAAAGEPLKEAEVLANLSQALLESGHVREARAGFAAVIATDDLPAHIALPVLGGFGVASATLGDEPRVQWVTREVRRLEQAGASRYAVASALYECAMALALVGQSATAARHAAAALKLARAHGFHEVAFKAESLDVSSPFPAAARRVRLNARGAAVARDVERLEPDLLPNHVALTTAGDE